MSNSTPYNLDAHYTTNPKVVIPKRQIVAAPNDLPNLHLYNDIDANNKMSAINNDIYQKYDAEKKKTKKGFLKFFLFCTLGVLSFFGIKKLIKK